jgi:hypothetical protein
MKSRAQLAQMTYVMYQTVKAMVAGKANLRYRRRKSTKLLSWAIAP